jgi:hypothetical protein
VDSEYRREPERRMVLLVRQIDPDRANELFGRALRHIDARG